MNNERHYIDQVLANGMHLTFDLSDNSKVSEIVSFGEDPNKTQSFGHMNQQFQCH